MNVFTKGSFDHDVASISDGVLLVALKSKISQLELAPEKSHITGLKLLRGYNTHYRIKVITVSASFRIGTIIRGNSIWLVRFLPRKKIYKHFP